MSERRNALEELRKLPEVFDISTFGRVLGMSRPSTSIYLSRWVKAGMLAPAGPRAGIYYNLVVASDAQDRCGPDAVRLLYPSVVMTGPSVLHAAGWTTQIPQRITLAAMARPTFAQVDGFEISPRSRRWYKLVVPRLSKDRNLVAYGFKCLTPAMALADCYASKDGWQPGPDDLDLDDADFEGLREAFDLFGVDIPDWLPTPPRP